MKQKNFYLEKEKEIKKEFFDLQKKIFISFQKYSLNEILYLKIELFKIEEQLKKLEKLINRREITIWIFQMR